MTHFREQTRLPALAVTVSTLGLLLGCAACGNKNSTSPSTQSAQGSASQPATELPPPVTSPEDTELARTANDSFEALTNQPIRLSFTVQVQDQSINYQRFFAIALPGELLEFDIEVPPDTEQPFTFDLPEAGETVTGESAVAWKAPDEPGHHRLAINDPNTGERMEITLFVMRPLDEKQDGILNGYRIGDYEDIPLAGNPVYNKPAGLIEYTEDMEGLALSPHFTLDQFLCKQATSSDVKYLLVQPALILKLEKLLEDVNARRGVEANTIFIMSGYRTPYYNESIGNVPYSRHVYGDASDIYIDEVGNDGVIDDLNDDGQITRADAAWLYDMAEELDNTATRIGLRQGGIGEYGANAVRGPFVHIDTRGVPARWGR